MVVENVRARVCVRVRVTITPGTLVVGIEAPCPSSARHHAWREWRALRHD